MIRALLMILFWAIIIPFGALIFFPWTFITGRVDALYNFGMWGARTGIRIAGVRVRFIGRKQLDRVNCEANGVNREASAVARERSERAKQALGDVVEPSGKSRACIYMANHVSNLDPPALIPNLPQRVSVMVKRELFRIPLLGRAMRMASLVPIERKNKESAIAGVRAAAEVLRSGLSIVVFPEGTRSPDGRLLPFKKGPFYMALETGAPIVPVTILGTRDLMPKGKLAIRPGVATVIFHPPIAVDAATDRDELIAKVRAAIESSLPREN
jgi:1-acyl-sn-glycerol-3-phosphate acyltransferase